MASQTRSTSDNLIPSSSYTEQSREAHLRLSRAAATWGWRWRQHGVEGGGVEGGGGGAEVGGGVEGGGTEVGQSDGAKPNFTAIRVLCRRRYPSYIWYIIGIGSCHSADTKNFIYGIG
jgi:hypothetical protein